MVGLKFLVLSCVAVVVLAEPPRFRPARFRFQRLELAPTTTDLPIETTTEVQGLYPPSGWRPAGAAFTFPKDATEAAPTDTYGPPEGPYPASGWKPSGQPFTLPQQQSPPATSYGVPDNTYGPPANVYGAPDDANSTETVTTDNPQAEKLDGTVEVQKSVGTYYVLLPNGQLQRVEFVTENDVQNMKLSARLQYQQPAPLFVLGP